jgi:hypothetical protein
MLLLRRNSLERRGNEPLRVDASHCEHGLLSMSIVLNFMLLRPDLYIRLSATAAVLRRYCTLLQATMPHVPNVMPIEPKELLEFCSDAGYNCRLELRGTWFTPPDYNVGMTDWERSLRLRCSLVSSHPQGPVRRCCSMTSIVRVGSCCPFVRVLP